MGKHYPVLSMTFVAGLLDSLGKIEFEVTAVIPVLHLTRDFHSFS